MGQYRNTKGQEAGPITNSDLFHAAGTRDRVTLDLRCGTCGRVGKVTWEENAAGYHAAGPQRSVVDVTPGFHSEIGRLASGNPLIVCDDCDAIQPD